MIKEDLSLKKNMSCFTKLLKIGRKIKIIALIIKFKMIFDDALTFL